MLPTSTTPPVAASSFTPRGGGGGGGGGGCLPAAESMGGVICHTLGLTCSGGLEGGRGVLTPVSVASFDWTSGKDGKYKPGSGNCWSLWER